MINHGKKPGWRRLLAATVAILVVWTVVLPWIGARPALRARIEGLESQGVDPAALYYTDLEAMPRLESNVADAVRDHPEAFW